MAEAIHHCKSSVTLWWKSLRRFPPYEYPGYLLKHEQAA
jgi:hypothetical protein